MEILYLHQYFATPKSNGGTRSYEFAKRLVADGHQVTFVTSSAFLNSKDHSLTPGWNELHIEGILLHVYHLPYSNTDSFIKRISKFIKFSFVSTKKALSIKSDVLFATSTPLTIGIPALIYKKFKKVPMVFEVRDLWPELPIAVGAIKNTLLIKILYAFERYIYRNAEHIVALSPGMKEGVKKQGISDNSITVIPNSCDTALFKDVKSSQKFIDKNLPFLNDRKLIVYAGTFGLINRVDYIADLAKAALDKHPNLCFIAIGSGMHKEDVIAKANSLGVLEKNLYILDPISKEQVKYLYREADLCLSLFGPVEEMWHNSANKLFDALASQTPIAINYGGWQKEFIEKTGCGLVLTNDFDNAVYQINNLLNDQEKYKKAQSACYDLSHNDFSRDKLYQKFKQVLLDVRKSAN